MISILALPAFSNKLSNPYNYLLYSNMNREVEIMEFSMVRVLLKQYEVFHIHWPDAYLNAPLSKAIFNTFAICIIFFVARLKGAKIVWTVHNIGSHDKKHRILSKIIEIALRIFCDGLIYLSEYSMRKHLEYDTRFTASRRRLVKVIPHGDYRDIYENSVTKEEALNHLSINDGMTYLFFGMIREYKGYREFISLAKNNPRSNFIIAGLPGSPEIRNFIISNAPSNLKFELRLIGDEEVQYFFNACDFVIMPYKNLFNSGVLFLSLTFNRPIIIAESEYSLELAQNFRNTVFTYKDNLPDINLNDFTFSLSEAGEIPDWRTIAKSTSDFYEQVINK